MSVIHAPRKPELDLRLFIFPFVMFLALAALFLRLWYIQVVRAPVLVEKAEATRRIKVDKLAPRGLIYDRQGKLVASVRPEIVITAIPAVVKKNSWVVDKVALILGTEPKKLQRKIDDATWRPYLASPIYVGTSIEAGTRIAEAGDALPGIGVETQPMRYYPDSRSYAHVLGYVWTPSDKDVKRIKDQGQNPADYVGKSGVELAYESALMGEPGSEAMEVDAKRRPVRVSGREAPTPGNQLFLSLDARLQRRATQLFEEKGFTGAVAALDPKTGEVLCLVSAPTYDQGLFRGGISQEDWDRLNSDAKKPLYNRAIKSHYPPGSTFKIVTAVAAYQQGRFGATNTYVCPGGYYQRGVRLKCLGNHGAISFNRAMEKSCNTYFVSLGMSAGEDAIRKAALDMGLGQKPGLEIGGDFRGVVPTREWIQSVSRDKKYHWYAGDTANFSVGQGYMSATPLQMANVVAMVANNGISYRPHLVRAVRDPWGKTGPERLEPEIAHQVDAPPAFWETIRRSLVSVVESGTAQSAKVQGLVWGGKTGSAEHGGKKRGEKTHGWFVGYAPADNPKIAICVLVEKGGHGGEVAAPIAGELVKLYLGLDKPAVPSSDAAASNLPATSSERAASSNRPVVR